MGLSKATGSCRLLCRALHKSLLESATLFRSWQSKKSDVGYRERCRPALQRLQTVTSARFRESPVIFPHHALRVARGADTTAFAVVGHEVVVPKIITQGTGKAVSIVAALVRLQKPFE
jgi:hypothetical protein